MTEARRLWLPRTKLTISILILALFIFLLTRFSAAIPPFILALILAFVLNSPVNKLEERLSISRGLITGLVFLVVLTLLVLIPVVFFPPLGEQIADLNLDFQLLLQRLEELLAHRYVIAGQTIDGAAIFNQIVGVVQEIVQPLFGETLGFAFDLISSLVWVVFIFVVSFYLVKDNASVVDWLDRLPPPDLRADFRRLRQEINQIWAAFFRGQLILGTVVATLFTAIGFAIGLPFALAMGVLAGLLEFLPSLGHGIWLTIATIMALFAGSTLMNLPNWIFALIIVGLHIVFQQFDLNYLIPRIIGRQVHLSPLVVILGIVAGAATAGVLGVLLAAPTVASARVLGRYIFANLSDTDPFPDLASSPLPPPDPRWWAIGSKSPDEEQEVEENDDA
ncbi:MAG: AI-2E family transporter [Anaerolineales bacterium]|nr:AI-2E family transporter [Chloroflexota bacterium]MBL6983612.1 AI-2E family transporter [Anaerolineales bacterium]